MQQLENFLLILILCSISFNISAQTSTNDDYAFTIHVGAFVKADVSDFQNIRDLGYIYADKMQNNLLQIYLGEFETESIANQTLLNVQRKGFPDAYITRRVLGEGTEQHLIQLETKLVSDEINWEDYVKAGPLYVLLHNNVVKILTGTFINSDEAHQRLAAVKAMGFTDAFTKRVNSEKLHKVTDFETSGPIVPPAVVAFNEAKVNQPKTTEENEIPESFETTLEIPDDIPTEYGDVLTAKSPETSSKTKVEPVAEKTVESPPAAVKVSLAVPTIRTNVKRRSALELQKLLKTKGSYTGSVDGLYGKITRAGYEKYKKECKNYQKYNLLSQHQDVLTEKTAANIVQQSINMLPSSGTVAVQGLASSKEAIAKAYRAYQSFITSGESEEVDQLMNAAINQAFKNSDSKGIAFDPSATYSYKNTNQVIKHLAYIHSVGDGKYKVPCWLFQRHPEEAGKAFDNVTGYTLELCDQFDSWEEIRVLKTIAMDMHRAEEVNESLVNAANAKRAKLFLSPAKPSADERRWMLQWDAVFWEGINEWAAQDPLHDKIVNALKLSYFQSQVLLEDHFMNNDFKADDAKALALSVLQTLVQPYLDEYVLKG